jgi:hypothetical protein
MLELMDRPSGTVRSAEGRESVVHRTELKETAAIMHSPVAPRSGVQRGGWKAVLNAEAHIDIDLSEICTLLRVKA